MSEWGKWMDGWKRACLPTDMCTALIYVVISLSSMAVSTTLEKSAGKEISVTSVYIQQGTNKTNINRCFSRNKPTYQKIQRRGEGGGELGVK